MNMSYCRYENTLAAVKQLDEMFEGSVDEICELSKDELVAMQTLVKKLSEFDFGELADTIEEAIEIQEELEADEDSCNE